MAIPEDWKKFVESLNANDVEYLIIGAHALGLHGVPRLTQDIDFFVRSSMENGEKIIRALDSFGFSFKNLKAADFTVPNRFVQLGYPPNRIDLITGIAGVDFEQAWSNRVETEFAGVPARFIGLREFIMSKVAAGRPKDLGDVDVVERVQRRQNAPATARRKKIAPRRKKPRT